MSITLDCKTRDMITHSANFYYVSDEKVKIGESVSPNKFPINSHIKKGNFNEDSLAVICKN